MRCVMVRVLPVPAPARMQTGPVTACAAARCSSSRAASTASAPETVFVLAPIGGLPAPPSCPVSLDPPSPGGHLRGSIPRGVALPPFGYLLHDPRRTRAERARRISHDVCRRVCRDDVHHHLVRVLRPTQEADAARR